MKCSICKKKVKPITRTVNLEYNIGFEFCPECGSILRDFTETEKLTSGLDCDIVRL